MFTNSQKPKNFIQTFNIESGDIIYTYDNKEDFCYSNGYSKKSIGCLLTNGYYCSEKRNPNSTKIGIRSIQPKKPIKYY